MKLIKLMSICGAITGLFLSATAIAHHSIAGEFDTETEFELAGVVTDLEWFNPHIWVYMDVTSADGTVSPWQCEMGSPNSLLRAGWKKADLPSGTSIVVKANPARDGTKTCSSRNLTLKDGTPVFSRAAR